VAGQFIPYQDVDLHAKVSGYVRRINVEGAPSRVVSLTEKGWKVAEIQRATVHAIEDEWARRIGKQRFQVFYDVLKELSGAL